MFLLAVSGGPDSMFLLNRYKNKKIIVVHANYCTREDSDDDEKVVSSFCKKNDIKFIKRNFTYKNNGNFEKWARDERYSFFKEIYDKYNCKKLIVGHHKDDFLETALMQQRSKRTPLFFGIKTKTKINGMVIYRPLIKEYWKDEILEIVKKKKINYAIDLSNFDPEYATRNKIRNELKGWSVREKQNYLDWFKMSNKILRKKEAKINVRYKIWTKTQFSTKWFKENNKYESELVFKFLTEEFDDVKISSKKINAIVAFIKSPNGNIKYKLDDNNYVIKKNGVIKKLD